MGHHNIVTGDTVAEGLVIWQDLNDNDSRAKLLGWPELILAAVRSHNVQNQKGDWGRFSLAH